MQEAVMMKANQVLCPASQLSGYQYLCWATVNATKIRLVFSSF